jgi:hypothetical protein
LELSCQEQAADAAPSAEVGVEVDAASDEEGGAPGPVQNRWLSTPRTAAWRARRVQKRAAKEEALVEALGQDGYNALLVKRQKCKARVALHRQRAAQASAE